MQDAAFNNNVDAPTAFAAHHEGSEKRRTVHIERANQFMKVVRRFMQLLYQRCFVEFILRQQPLPPSENGRHVPLRIGHNKALIDERRGRPFIHNAIRSSRYTLWDFLPKQFIFQATRLSNFYFICIGVPQTIPGLSTTGNYTTILPLMFFMLLTVFKEGYDDYKRHRLDKVENNYIAKVLREKDQDFEDNRSSRKLLLKTKSTISDFNLPFSKARAAGSEEMELDQTMTMDDCDQDLHYGWTKVKWQDIRVGDVLRLDRDDALPADVALLYADGENGAAYIETMALDGETNLKSKQPPSALLESCHSIKDIRDCDAHFVLEDPNRNLYDFNGKVTFNGKTLPLTLNEVILRGSVLRNTGRAIGIVINTGEECKIRMNANHHPRAKKPRLERYANQIVLTLVFYVVILSVGCSMGYLLWHASFEKRAWYLHHAYVQFQQIIIGYLIAFNNVIPLALYVSLEIVKIGQMLILQSDCEMYDEVSDTPMTCNTNTILENLGQISYILSDKTGTLTENVMRLRGISLGGIAWRHGTDTELDNDTTVRETRVGKHNIKASSPGAYANSNAGQSSETPPAIVIEEREISSTSASDFERSRSSFMSNKRKSWGQSPPTRKDRSTIELLDIMHLGKNSKVTRQARDMLLAMALCNTALPETIDGQTDFQASSPDEIALVRAAKELGYSLSHRSSQKIGLLITSKTSHTEEFYEILDVIEFSSQRKRMSIILRCPDGRLWLICKGADSAIIPLLRQTDLAARKSKEVKRSLDVERQIRRKSEQNDQRTSFGARSSFNILQRESLDFRTSLAINRLTLEVPHHIHHARLSLQEDLGDVDDSTLFSRCFKHINDFATEGLRTLLFAHRYLEPAEYENWKKIYIKATTSLNNRQDEIDAASELMEHGLDLLGASAIEDKLQKGVPETVDKLRRANIRMWMLTGDKRETAINIAYSARICQPSSMVYVIDSSKGDLYGQMNEIIYETEGHRVAVIDGHTLSVVNEDLQLKHLFFALLIANIDSVIVCRASPAQKAEIVEGIRARLPGLTLAIGDGANDIAMIQAAHVGIGISGKEGLQAARVADYSIAQFRYLQRLLFVHGRYQYVRTAKFILLTFWKEMFFYMMQALYQRYNGYTGTSLYESWSLTVLNTLFTSLCVIIPGVFEQDLRPNTLLAIPELYEYGQRNRGLNLDLYLAWILHATVNGLTVWFIVWAAFGKFKIMGDNGLFALGDLVFSIAIMWTNVKIFMFEIHYKTIIVGTAFGITIAGWWAWNALLSGLYSSNISPYDVKGGFLEGFGGELTWWLTLILVLAILVATDLAYSAIKRHLIAMRMWPSLHQIKWRLNKDPGVEEDMEVEFWQDMERDPEITTRLNDLAKSDQG